MKSKILKVISRIDFKEKEGRLIKTDVWKDVYTYTMLCGNNIKKNKSVALAHHLGAEEEILFLIQNGLTETDSFIITENFISIAKSNLFSKNDCRRIQWDDLIDVKLVNHNVIFYTKSTENQTVDIKEVFANNISKEHILVKLLKDILTTLSAKENVLTKTDDYLQDKGISRKQLYKYGGIALVLLFLFGASFFSDKISNSNVLNQNRVEDTSINTLVKEEKIITYDTLYSLNKIVGYTDTTFIQAINIFNEPKNVTLEASGFFHGKGDKVVIPIEMPKNIEYWFYTLNLSNAVIVSGDNNLIDNVNTEIERKLGKDGEVLTETQNINSSFVREIVNSINQPTRQEAFVNAYFFNNSKEAHNFQDKKDFNYNINYSLKNTHSCKGFNKYTKGDFVYIGLENEGYDDNIYANIEVVAIKKVKKYYKIQQHID
jgi:hypothetical protein